MNVKEKNTVALMMTNSADLVSIWLGIAKLGASTALINTNNLGASLIHSLTAVLDSTESKILIIDESLRNHVSNDIANITAIGIKVYFWNTATHSSNSPDQNDLKRVVLTFPSSRIRLNKKVTAKSSDPLVFIYTSGTTGN